MSRFIWKQPWKIFNFFERKAVGNLKQIINNFKQETHLKISQNSSIKTVFNFRE